MVSGTYDLHNLSLQWMLRTTELFVIEQYWVNMNKLYFKLVESQIKKALDDSKSAEEYDNQVLKGRAREIFISNLLRPFLSADYNICTGHVIDSKNGHSRQIDIIVFDSRIIPPIMLSEGEGIIPYEGVLATIEVKTKLDAGELNKSIENARSIKTLVPNFQEIFKNRFIKHSPVCYVFAFDTDLKQKEELKRLKEQVDKSNEAGTVIKVPISGLCVANKCFLLCENATSTPPEFCAISQGKSHTNVMEFLLNLVNTCNTMATERGRIYLNMYLNK